MNIVRISDGLGNQMFQYAFARKTQIICDRSVYLDIRFINYEDVYLQDKRDHFHKKCGYRRYGLNAFRICLPEAEGFVLKRWKYISQNTLTDKFIYSLAQIHFWPWLYKEESKCGNFLFNTLQLDFPTYFQGYFFDLNYYDDIKYILQKEFRVKKPIRLTKEMRDLLEKDNTVGIHIRKGDFTKLSRDISQTDYYPKALETIEERIVHPVYLVFSDDIGWVKKNLNILGEKIYVSEMGFADYEEMTIMKHCKHNIIANSTFSYWAAYLNDNPNKIVICPKRWKPNIIPKEWIRV